MEIGECSVAEEDGKPSASPQHLTTTTRRLDDDVGSATAESGIAMATLTASTSSALLKRCGSSFGNAEEIDLKRSKLEADSVDAATHTSTIPKSGVHRVQSQFSSEVVQTTTGNRLIVGATPQDTRENLLRPINERSSDGLQQSGEASHVSDSNSSLSATQPQNQDECQEPINPPKATQYQHLHLKYFSELEYMLREFQKLERQLLGAKTAVGSAETESAASRERREKLHSFIQHLEDTIQQIIAGVELESTGQDTHLGGTVSQPNKAKGTEEAVQKIEEHILANLLPVKVRLKKQLAAQQGAKHNPASMPAVRGGLILQSDASQQGKATFLNKVEERRTSLYGALQGGGSNLTQKLYGPTTGSSSLNAVTVDSKKEDDSPRTASLTTEKKPEQKILYAGLALGSSQILSSVTAANAVHKVEIQDPALIQVRSQLHLALAEEAGLSSPTSEDYAELKLSTLADSDLAIPESGDDETALSDDFDDDEPDHIYSKKGTHLSQAAHAAIMSYEEKRKARKKRRKRKKLLLLQQHEQQQQQAVVAASTAGSKRKKIVKKRGPQSVEYMCALCNEVYDSTCDYNPWWALTQHECPKCNKFQIPRIDIGAPANAIEYHPALLAHADENGGIGVHTPESVILPPPPQPKDTPVSTSDTEEILESDLSDDDGLLSDDDSFYCSDSDGENFPIVSAADRAENEKFGLEYDGPVLRDEEASRLISLMMHANTCPCRHLNSDHLEVCRSTKYMMLHVRDCPGTTSSFDVCPFPWCRKVKHLLYHLISCPDPNSCGICSNLNLNRNMRRLQGLNYHRGEIYQQLLSSKARSKSDAENVKLESSEQAAPKVDDKTLTSDSDSLEVMLLDELKRDDDVSNLIDAKINSTTEISDAAAGKQESVTESEIPLYTTNKDIDYSINPPVDVPIPANSETTSAIPVLASDPTFVSIKIEMDTAHSDSNDTSISHEQISTSVVDTNILTDETMVLPAIGSDHTLVHRNNTSDENENVDVESSSLQNTSIEYQSITPDCIVKLETDLVDVNIRDSVMAPAIESDTTTVVDGKTSNGADNTSEPTTVVGEDFETGAKVEKPR